MKNKMNRGANDAEGIKKVLEKVERCKRRLADCFYKKCQHLSTSGLLALLIAFSVLYSFYLLRLITRAIH